MWRREEADGWHRHDAIGMPHNEKQITPTQVPLPVCSICPRGKAYLSPPRQIHINTQDAEQAMWGREEAGVWHRHHATGITT